MTRWRKKPIEVEAVQWFPWLDIPGVFTEKVIAVLGGRGHGSQDFEQPPCFYVVTAHGQRVYLSPGDWVITESDGRGHYPCKDEIFRATYQPAVDGPPA